MDSQWNIRSSRLRGAEVKPDLITELRSDCRPGHDVWYLWAPLREWMPQSRRYGITSLACSICGTTIIWPRSTNDLKCYGPSLFLSGARRRLSICGYACQLRNRMRSSRAAVHGNRRVVSRLICFVLAPAARDIRSSVSQGISSERVRYLTIVNVQLE